MNFFAYRHALWHGGSQSVAADAAINYTDHDKRYHHGNFDPNTMTCEMREAEAKGDLVDVLNAEQEEKDFARQKRKQELREKREAEQKAAAEKNVKKTIAELTSRSYSDEDRRLTTEAIDHVLNATPVVISHKGFQEAIENLRGDAHDAKSSVENIAKYFAKSFPKGISVDGLGTVYANHDSAQSIVAHSQPKGVKALKLAAISVIDRMLKMGKVFAINSDWKDRGWDSVSMVTPFDAGRDALFAEITMKRTSDHEYELYNVKVLNAKVINETLHTSQASRQAGNTSGSLTTAHSIPNSPAGVNRDITENSHSAEPPRIPGSNLMKQYLAAHGLLGQFLQK